MTIFQNQVIDKKQLKQILSKAFNEFGMLKASYLAHQLKDLGFEYATRAGLSVSIEDLRVPPSKRQLVELANKKVYQSEINVKAGIITEVERFQKVIYTWSNTSETLKDQVVNYFRNTDPLNSIYMMAFSGARGNLSQVRQLVGMRGLMSNPNGQIIDLPITANFREGLKVTDYIISSYGARKGLVDTALKTADSGYLTRRLIDVAQEIITRERNCKTKYGIILLPVLDRDKFIKTALSERIVGRLLASSIKDSKNNKIIAKPDQEITPALAKIIQDLNLDHIIVRSPVTCGSIRSVCQYCYGWNLAYGRLIDLGEAVGIIAAQSIGEPGTQLTMRTFHTGGVFTAELSRQVHAEFSGKISYSKTLKAKQIRTAYGEIAYTSEQESKITLVSYKNFKLDLKVLPTNLILVKNDSIVKQNDILLELSAPSTSSEKVLKNIKIKQGGQLVVERQKTKEPIFTFESSLQKLSTCLIWILSGQVYTIPLKSVLPVHNFSKIRPPQTLAEANLTSINDGIVKLVDKENMIESIDIESGDLEIIYDFELLTNLNLYIEEDPEGIETCTIYGSNNWRVYLTALNSNKIFPEKLGSLINIEYRTQTGGTFYSTAFFRENIEISIKHNLQQFKMGGTIFYIAESTYTLPYDEPIFFNSGDKILINDEIYKNCFSFITGYLEIMESNTLFRDIIIRPGKLILLEKEKGFRFYNKKILYPGEIIFDTIRITYLCFSEIKKFNGKNYLALYPIIRYEILSFKNSLETFSENSCRIFNENIILGKLERKFEKKIKSYLPYQFIEQALLANSNLKQKNLSLKVQLVEDYQTRNLIKLNLVIFENILIEKFIPKELKKINLQTSTFIQDHQYIEPFSKISSFQILLLEPETILNIKEQLLPKERKLLLTKTTDFKKLYIEEPYIFTKSQVFIKIIDKIKSGYNYPNSGLIISQDGNSNLLHIASPYLIAQGGSIYKRPSDLVNFGENLAQLSYQRARTGDIVQGLPRIEEILEARKPKTQACLAERPGIVLKIFIDSLNISIWVGSKNITKYTFPKKYRLLVSKFEFINVGQPLEDAALNHHNLLDIYFRYYDGRKLLTSYKAAYKSFRKIQSVLIRSIQAIYESQGVKISDKHIEIIIKQMTGKVQVISSEDSPLLPEELLDLNQIYYINKALGTKKNALFKPILLGITKASLKTNSFISAASFQYTTRILTEAAIQGKIDWLRGLKENVIVGRLIPAGTGFNIYSDISFLIVTVPSKFTKLKQTPQPRVTYAKLKSRKKFKFV
jgi:DNA-directed RNA polymerase subunit beta'